MGNHIRQVMLSDTRIEPVAAEVRISVFPEQLTHTTDIRGQLVGPRCAYASTVEVAYPMRTWSLADQPRELPHLSLSVVIPEPSLWEPATPFLYEGPVELWENGKCVDKRVIRHGLRDIRLGNRGMRLNGQAFTIRGVGRRTCAESEADCLKAAGFNTFYTPDLASNPEILGVADRVGFFVLSRISGPVESYLPFDPDMCGHPSVLGWVLTESAFSDEALMIAANFLASFDAQGRLGIELPDVPEDPLPDGISFVVCDVDLLPALGHIHRPKVVRTEEQPEDSAEWKAVLSAPGVLGWVCNQPP